MSARSDSPGTVLPLSASVLCSELSGREEAVHSAGHTAAEYKTAFPSTCHLLTVWSYKYEHRSSENVTPFLFVTQTQAVRCQNHHTAALLCNVRCMLILSDDVTIKNESDSWLTCINGSCLVTI